MAELMVQSVSPSRSDTFPRTLLDGCRSSVAGGAGTRYGKIYSVASPAKSLTGSSSCSPPDQLKHSKSSDALLSGPISSVNGHDASSFADEYEDEESSIDCPISFRKNASEDSVVAVGLPSGERHSVRDSRGGAEARVSPEGGGCQSETREGGGEDEVEVYPSGLATGGGRRHARIRGDVRRSSSTRHVGLYDQVDPEDSIKDMVSENDFYRFVLFKKHYEKYINISQKYEEARNIAYYLEEKYHEVKAERDGLAIARLDLERRLERRELELHDKEEELFLQLEKVVRLEEDCEKLRAQKEKFEQWKDKLEEEKNEAYRQLQREAAVSEAVRRRMEAARQDVVKQVTVIAAERESLEKENEMLKDKLKEERKGVGHYLVGLAQQKQRISKNVVGLEKEVTDLQFVARQTASLNNQFKKGMKHLATCKKRKCSVCNYTRATFGEYEDRHQNKLLSCIQTPLQDLRNWIRPTSQSEKCSPCSGGETEDCEATSSMVKTRRESGNTTPLSNTPSASSDCLIHSSPVARSSRSPRPIPPPPTFFPGPPTHCSCRGKHRVALTPCSCPPRPSSFCPRPSLTPDISYIDEASTSGEGEVASGGEDDGEGQEDKGAIGIRDEEEEEEEEVADASLGSCYVDDDLSSSHDAADDLTTTISAHYDEYDDEADEDVTRETGGVVRAQSCPCGGPSLKGADGGVAMMTCSGSPALPPSCSVPNDASLASTSTSASEQQPRANSTRAFSSDSGFSSEMCEPVFCQRGGGGMSRRRQGGRRRSGDGGRVSDGEKEEDQVGCGDPGSFRRSKWTASFRKLIHRVSKRFQGHHL